MSRHSVPRGRGWGIPLGSRVEHCWLGALLLEGRSVGQWPGHCLIKHADRLDQSLPQNGLWWLSSTLKLEKRCFGGRTAFRHLWQAASRFYWFIFPLRSILSSFPSFNDINNTPPVMGAHWHMSLPSLPPFSLGSALWWHLPLVSLTWPLPLFLPLCGHQSWDPSCFRRVI